MKTYTPIAFSLLMVFAMIAWGLSWPTGKAVARYAEPEVVIFWRFIGTFISLIPILLILKIPLKLNLKSSGFILAGSILYLSYNFGFISGLKHGFSGAGGVLVTTLNPIVTFLIVLIFFKHKSNFREISGLVLGLVSGCILLGIPFTNLQNIFAGGNLYFLISALLWSLLTICSQKSTELIHPLAFNLYIHGIGAFTDFFFAMPHNVGKVFSFDEVFWWNMIYLSVMPTTFGTTVYFYASGKVGSQKASSFIFIVPFTALISSWILLAEKPQAVTILGCLLALIAVYLINSTKKLNPINE